MEAEDDRHRTDHSSTGTRLGLQWCGIERIGNKVGLEESTTL